MTGQGHPRSSLIFRCQFLFYANIFELCRPPLGDNGVKTNGDKKGKSSGNKRAG